MPEGDTEPMAELRGETIPILAARDIAETIDFYGKLGFAVVRLYDGFGAPYLLLRRDDVELHFVHVPETDPKESDAGCYLRLVDAQSVYDEWEPLALDGVHPPKDTPWGMREFFIVDPSGNLIRIGTPLEA
jgi:catechol 2,3-dioxygenase-like lactoylglutathione lyase family enzyme